MKNSMLPSEFKSLWMDTTPAPDYPELVPGQQVDVVIVGGGMAGILAGYYLTKSGLKIAILEASKILAGTTGNTTAKVTSQHDLKYDYLKRNFSLDQAKIYADSNQWAIQELERIATEEQINCDLHRLPAYVYAMTEEGLVEIREEVEAAKELGLPASLVSEIPSLPFSIKGAIKFENQAIFHPRKFLLAIAEKIVSIGNHIFEKTQVQDIKEGEVSEVITDKGNIRAKFVIIATNYPIYDKGMFFARMNQMRSYALGAQLNTPLPEGMFINLDEAGLSFRPYRPSDGKEWLIIGGEDHIPGEDGKMQEHFEKLEQYARERFDIASIDYKWAAQDSSPIDRVPYIGRMPFSDSVFVTTGFGEWGMTTSFVSAKILTDLIMAEKSDWEELYKPSRLKPLASAPKIKEMAKHLVKGFGDYVTKRDSLSITDLQPDEGKIITQEGEKLAVYKDKDNKVHALSATCTHMGCMVDWNNTEKSWDCPCHGSRFDKDGNVLNGPAVKPLPKKEIKE